MEQKQVTIWIEQPRGTHIIFFSQTTARERASMKFDLTVMVTMVYGLRTTL